MENLILSKWKKGFHGHGKLDSMNMENWIPLSWKLDAMVIENWNPLTWKTGFH